MSVVNEYRSKWAESFEIYTTAATVSKIKILSSNWLDGYFVGMNRALFSKEVGSLPEHLN